MTAYTNIIDGFQIRDVTYLGNPPENAPIQFDIVKWEYHKPREVIDFRTGKKVMSDKNCYSVAFLVWNSKEPGFEFSSVGLRWLESGADDDVIKMILNFANKKEKELLEDEE